MTNNTAKTYRVGVIERAIAYYEVQAEDARTAAENWRDGEFDGGRDDESLDTEGPCSVRERKPDGTWRKVPISEWQDARALEAPRALRAALERAEFLMRRVSDGDHRALENLRSAADQARAAMGLTRAAAAGDPAKKPYSVLLLYPDYASDNYGEETYYAFVSASDSIAAVAEAQRQAVAAQEGVEIEPEDFAPLLVTEGHHYGQPLSNE